MRQFLLYGHVLSTEEAELYADYELKKNPPTLDNFKEQVCFIVVVETAFNLNWFGAGHHSLWSFLLWSMSLSHIIVSFFIPDQPVWVSVCTSEQDGGQEGVLWLATARYQTLQAHTDECHQEMELDVQGAPAQPCEPEVRHKHKCKHVYHSKWTTKIRMT